jgi:hypothetical protein
MADSVWTSANDCSLLDTHDEILPLFSRRHDEKYDLILIPSVVLFWSVCLPI